MKKAVHIAWKDSIIRLTDRTAFIFLLLTPLVLTLILGAAFGGFGGSSSGPSAIPVAVANLDDGELGEALANLFTSEDLSDLFNVRIESSASAARLAVDKENFAAAVIIPAGLTQTVIPGGFDLSKGMEIFAGGNSEPEAVNILIYTNPATPISASIVKAVVEAFGWQVSSSVVGGNLSVEQLLASGKLNPSGIMTYIQGMVERLQGQGDSGFQQIVTLRQQTVTGKEAGSDTEWVIAYYAPSMAIMFLSFGVTFGARTILEEERTGTLGRLLTTPTSAASILGGKLISTYLMGLLQFGILVGASSLIFGLDWGEPSGLITLSVALVAAMTSLGMMLSGIVRSEEQVNTWGVAVLLIFSAISGNFIPRFGFPTWLKTLGLITPNAWALEGFTKLGTGSGLGDVRLEIVALSIMAVLFFAIGVIGFRRRIAV